MTKREKLFEKISNNPKDISFSDIRKVLEQEDFSLVRIAGSHHVFKRNELTFVIPIHKNQVKSVYVKRVIELIEQSNYERRS